MAGPLLERDANPVKKDVDYREIGRLSISYLMTMISEVMRARQGDFVDVLIVMSIFNGNGQAKRGVSRNALAKMLDMPLETARRRVNRLLQNKTLVEQADGLVFAYGDDLKPGQLTPLDELNIQQLRKLFRAVKEQGLELE